MPIDELVRQFEAFSLPSDLWTHAAHLSVALWYLRHHPRDEATRLIRAGIQVYNAANDKRLAYHETITLAWIEVISRFLAEHDRETPLADLQRELLERCGDKDFLLRFYSRERLSSEAARQQWLPPDRQTAWEVVSERTQSPDASARESGNPAGLDPRECFGWH